MLNRPRRVAACLAPLLGCPAIVLADDKLPQKGEVAGYLLVPHEKVDKKYDAGFSMYVAVWPLLTNYPGQDFQSGLFGTPEACPCGRVRMAGDAVEVGAAFGSVESGGDGSVCQSFRESARPDAPMDRTRAAGRVHLLRPDSPAGVRTPRQAGRGHAGKPDRHRGGRARLPAQVEKMTREEPS